MRYLLFDAGRQYFDEALFFSKSHGSLFSFCKYCHKSLFSLLQSLLLTYDEDASVVLQYQTVRHLFPLLYYREKELDRFLADYSPLFLYVEELYCNLCLDPLFEPDREIFQDCIPLIRNTMHRVEERIDSLAPIPL